MEQYLTIGIVLGLSAGFAPGPLLTLVISETLRHDVGSGVRVALAPAVTDLPIIAISLFVLSKLSDFHGVLGAISLLGGLFVLVMGYESISSKGVEVKAQEANPKSLAKGVLVNALSPHPYLFWFSVGAPIVIKAMNDPGVILLDDRDRDEWLGLRSSPYDPEFVPRKGRIPGARWIEWQDFMNTAIAIPAFKSAREILDICLQKQISPGDDIILYCFKGSRASNTYIALRLAGFKKVRIYFASWYEWAADLSLPIDAAKD